MEIKPGQIWKHYKGDTYKIVTLAKFKDADLTDGVVYERLNDLEHTDWRIYCRNKDKLLGKKYISGKIFSIVLIWLLSFLL